jgi:hypothetical protein
MTQRTDRGLDSVFEEQVMVALQEKGYQVHPQVGIAGFFIDLAMADEQIPGKYILGIECDGAAYHNSGCGPWSPMTFSSMFRSVASCRTWCRFAFNRGLPHFVWRSANLIGIIRALRSSGPALPYIARLIVFSRLI